MANEWLRLWHDMPTDPKWRVIAKASGQPLHLVIALYTVLLVDASKNKKSRGVTTCHDEDLSVTLDCDMSQIEAIKQAMQGRVLDGNNLKGWEVRQPKKEDQGDQSTGAKSAAERKAAQRARDKAADENGENEACHEMSRNVTLDKDKEEDKEKNKYCATPDGFDAFWAVYPKRKSKGDAVRAWNRIKPNAELRERINASLQAMKASDEWRKDAGKFIPYPASWLNAMGWEDEVCGAANIQDSPSSVHFRGAL